MPASCPFVASVPGEMVYNEDLPQAFSRSPSGKILPNIAFHSQHLIGFTVLSSFSYSKMLIFTILFSVLPAVLAMTQAEADKWCQDQRGPGFMAELDAAGNPVKCVTSSASCFGNEYKDPVSGQTKCCPVYPANTVYSFDPVTKVRDDILRFHFSVMD